MTEWNATTQSGKQVKPELIPFARWLVARMKERRLENNQLALKLGVSTSAVSEYRRALRRPRRDAQEKLARVFGDEPETVYRLLERTAPITINDTLSPLAVIDDIRAYLDRLAAQIVAGEVTDDEARALLEEANSPPNGSAL